MLSETKMRCFISLAKTLSFTNTASVLGISQQAVSKHISQLEDDLGFKLIKRSKRNVSLTDSGKKCYELFDSFFKDFDDFVSRNREESKKSLTLKSGYLSWYDYGKAPLKALYGIREKKKDFELVGERSDDTILLIKKLKEKSLDLVLMDQNRFENDPVLDYEFLGPASANASEHEMLICVFNKNDNNEILRQYVSLLKKEYQNSNNNPENDNV